MTPRILRLPDGRRFEIVEQGGRGGTALLLLHGITDTWRSFEPVLPWLPDEWHVVALTQRGHGGSDAAASYRTRDFAADAARSPYRPASAPELPPLTTMPATLPASEVQAAPQVDAAPIDTRAASMPTDSTLDKGLKGLK